MATSSLSSYLASIMGAVQDIDTFDAARYLDIVNRNAEGAKQYIIRKGQESAAAMAGLTADRQAADVRTQQGLNEGMETVRANQVQAAQNLLGVAEETGTDPTAAQNMNALGQQAVTDLYNAGTFARAHNENAANEAAAANASGMAQVQNAALDNVDMFADQARAEIEATAADIARSGGGGGGGGGGGYGGGGYGGGGGGGSDDYLSAGDRERYARLLNFEREGTLGDYKTQVEQQYGGRGAPLSKRARQKRQGKNVIAESAYGENLLKDILTGAPGGAKGHLAEDLSNADEIIRNQLAFHAKAQKEGKKTGYSRKTIKNIGKLLKKIGYLPQEDLKKLEEDYSTLELLDAAPELLEGMVPPREAAAEQAAAASNPGPSGGQRAKALRFAAKQQENERAEARNKTQRANLLRAAAFNQEMARKGSIRRRRGYKGKRPGRG